MPSFDPAQRVLAAQIAAYTRWSRTDDPTTATTPGRKAFLDRFEREVDPDGKLDPAERARRAALARKAYFLQLALKSSKARKARALAAKLEAEVAQELADTIEVVA